MRAALNYIRNHHFKEALNVLNSVERRNARWYYFSAVANNGVGNNMIALEHAKMAVQMEPSNIEYRQYLEYMENGGTWYRNRGSVYQNPVGGSGRWCLNLLLLNCLCNFCCCPAGGGGIYC
jgi:molecular chaperone DnaJ